MRHLAASVLACIMAALCMSGCKKERIPQRSTEETVRELVRVYGANADSAETEPLLTELKQTDSEAGALWEGILRCWEQTGMDMPYSKKRLPEGLPEDNTLCIIVLGYQLNPDGSMQDELKGRLRTALACAKQYPNAIVLCTGGGTAWRNRNATEAGQMADWLAAHGIARSRLIAEDRSRTTAENARFSCQCIREQQPQITSAAIVTSDYHIPWGKLMFEAEFRLCAAEGSLSEIRVDACCAYEIGREGFGEEQNRSCQAAGLQYLIGEHMGEQDAS